MLFNNIYVAGKKLVNFQDSMNQRRVDLGRENMISPRFPSNQRCEISPYYTVLHVDTGSQDASGGANGQTFEPTFNGQCACLLTYEHILPAACFNIFKIT